MRKSVTVLFVLLFSITSFGADCHFQLVGDLDGNCEVNLADFAEMAKSWLINCNNTPYASQCIALDLDKDGFDSIDDCNDNDPSIRPEITDIPDDGIDQDCDGSDSSDTLWASISEPGFSGDICKFETTTAQYCQFLNEALTTGDIYVNNNRVFGRNGSNSGEDFEDLFYFAAYENDSYSLISFANGKFHVRYRMSHSMGSYPVNQVSWYGATAFCNYYGYRLPTKDEWQAVADYDGSYIYGCGNQIDQDTANYNTSNPLDFQDWPYSTPVNYYSSHGYGLHDMAGNVWEYTSTPEGQYYIVCGGGASSSEELCLVSDDSLFYSDRPNSNIGFRVCR